MKYDDASWHSEGDFPADSPPEYGGTHIGLLKGKMTGTEFLFRNCDGEFTDEDLNDEGNAFIGIYYAENGPYLSDYAGEFGDWMYVASEDKHDFQRFTRMVERRYSDHLRETQGS